MVASPENPPVGGHPIIEKRIEEPGELERLEKDRQELEGYIERVEHAPAHRPVTDDQTGQVVLTPAGSQQVTVTLPLTEDEIKHGLHHKIIDAIYWLSVWCLRIAKKAVLVGMRVVYPTRN